MVEKLYDPKQRALDDFIKNHKNEVMYYYFLEKFCLRVEVCSLREGATSSYENILVRNIEVPKCIKEIPNGLGTFLTDKNEKREWNTIKVNTKFYSAMFNLYNLSSVSKRLESKAIELENQVNFMKKNITTYEKDHKMISEIINGIKATTDTKTNSKK